MTDTGPQEDEGRVGDFGAEVRQGYTVIVLLILGLLVLIAALATALIG